jgi:antitoxin PrlF
VACVQGWQYEFDLYDSYMRVTEKGQVTIPKALRDALGIGAGTEVEFERRKNSIVVRKARGQIGRGRRMAERLRGRGDVQMTTDEIMALTRGD